MSAAGPILVGLIGRGIAASASPAIHEREAAAQGLALSYEIFDFDQLQLPDNALVEILASLAQRGFAGVNITHPFKQQVIPLLDEIDPTASALGAVNCVVFDDGRMTGWNSDWIGFEFMLRREFPDASYNCVAQIGAGGAGSATAFALLDMGATELRIHDTSPERIDTLIERLAQFYPDVQLVACSAPAQAIKGASGVVQSTPVGMVAHPGTPFDPALLEAGQWLAEVIYFPRETELLRAARSKGLSCACGAAMVIGQAAEAFRLFTGKIPDRDRMLEDLLATDRERAS